MRKEITCLILLSILLTFFTAAVTYGADEQFISAKKRVAVHARFAPSYSFPGAEQGVTVPQQESDKIPLGSPAFRGPIHTIGQTTYDYQHNCTMGRQVEHDERHFDEGDPRNDVGWFISFDWMAQDGDTLGSGRGVGFQSYSVFDCDFVFDPGGIRIETGYGGYVCLDVDTGYAIPEAHINASGYWSMAYWDLAGGVPMLGIFTPDYPLDVFGYAANNGTGPNNENLWPGIEWDVDGDDQVLHLVTTESGAPDEQTCSYYRRVGPYGAGLGIWSAQHVIDSVMNINVTVATSPISDKVAIVWLPPADFVRETADEFLSQWSNDVWFAVASDNGLDWATNPTNMGNPSIGNTVDLGIGGGYNQLVGGNLTTYDYNEDRYRAYCEVSAVWSVKDDPDDYLQIVWSGHEWIPGTDTLFRRSGGIWHWNQKFDEITAVAIADWDTGGACVDHAWATDVGKMNISECQGRLYTLFTQFGSADNPCGDVDANNQVVNGYLYMSVYDEAFKAWDRGQRVTNTPETPTGCIPGTMAGPGTCNSEYWATMARYGRYDTCQFNPPEWVLDVEYINDYAPGGCVQTESGVWTLNPVNWTQYECREVVPEPGYTTDAAGYGECFSGVPIVVAPPDGDTSVTLTITNPGLLVNNIGTITVNYIDGSGWLNVVPTSGTADPNGGTMEVVLTFTAQPAMPDPSEYHCEIIIPHDADNSPDTIPACFMVATDFAFPEAAIISTGTKHLRIYNNGEMSNGASYASLDFPGDCDTLNVNTNSSQYLYDASPMICRLDGSDTLRFTAYSTSFTQPDGLRPLSPLYVDSTSNPDYSYAISEFATADSMIHMVAEYFVPKAPDTSDFVIVRYRVWNLGEIILPGVYVGMVYDWDIPSDTGQRNGSGYDADLNLIYQHGLEYNNDNEGVCPQQQTDRYGGVYVGKQTDLKNAMTIDNATYVYDDPLPAGVMYELMQDVNGFSPSAVTDEDLSTIITFGQYDLYPDHDSVKEFTTILVTTKDYELGYFDGIYDQAVAWILDHVDSPGPDSTLPNDTAIIRHNMDPIWRPPMGDPRGTIWHELYPNYCQVDTLTSWLDNCDSKLSACDYVDFNDQHWPKYHVEWVGPTIKVTRWPQCHIDYPMYLDHIDFNNPDVDPIANPWCTYWHEVYPDYCQIYHTLGYIDTDGNGLDYCDYIILQRVGSCWDIWIYHVEEVTTDIILKEYTGPVPKWRYHYNYPIEGSPYDTCTTGDLTVWGTNNCVNIEPPVFQDTVHHCTRVSGDLPQEANDYKWRFEWHCWCNNVNVGKVAVPEFSSTLGRWKLHNLWRYVVFNQQNASMPDLGDPTGAIQEVYYVVDLEEWLAGAPPTQDEYVVVDGECIDLPGYLIGTTPITYDSLAGEFDNPFSTTPLTGTLVRTGTFELIYEDTECLCLPGDANGDGTVNVGDAVYTINYVFKGGPPPVPYNPCSGDANCDGTVNVGDAVYTINYVFKGGPAPCTCEEWVALNGSYE